MRFSTLRGWAARLGFALAVCAFASGCDLIPRYSPDPVLLASSGSGAPPAGPECSSCHSYPLHDGNHNYHLISANVNRNNLGQPGLNNVTTCLDCHFNSIKHFSYVHSDTFWTNAAGVDIMQHTEPTDKIKEIQDWPGFRPLGYAGADTTRGRFLAAEIDSMIFQYARVGKMVQWRTARAHDNGIVDVSFPPNDVTSPAVLASAYNPKDLSCSAIACHNNRAATYRWMSPRLGLGNCPSLTGDDPTCFEIIPRDTSGGSL